LISCFEKKRRLTNSSERGTKANRNFITMQMKSKGK
jgi:hypothetical protein